jgi:hypothetical protein
VTALPLASSLIAEMKGDEEVDSSAVTPIASCPHRGLVVDGREGIAEIDRSRVNHSTDRRGISMSSESDLQPNSTVAPTVAPMADSGAEEARRPSRGCACTLTAAVESNGTLVRGFGVVSAQKLQTGIYFVTFDRSVADCIYVATIGTPGNQFLMPTGQTTVAGVAGFPNSIDVTTHDSAGNFSDRGFHVAVHCRPQ